MPGAIFGMPCVAGLRPASPGFPLPHWRHPSRTGTLMGFPFPGGGEVHGCFLWMLCLVRLVRGADLWLRPHGQDRCAQKSGPGIEES